MSSFLLTKCATLYEVNNIPQCYHAGKYNPLDLFQLCMYKRKSSWNLKTGLGL